MKQPGEIIQQLSNDDPWPGLLAYQESNQQFFYGRDAEIEALFLLVKQQPATLLFGRSGLGKSSLLAAGLFPRLRPLDFFPVRIRILYDDGAASARAQLVAAILKEAERIGLEPVTVDESLSIWAWLRRGETEFWTADHRLLRPVIVFDQFEEIFTRGTSSAASRAISSQLMNELEALVLDQAPSEFLAELEVNPKKASLFDLNKNVCKIVLALREDFLPQFEAVAARLGPLVHYRMRLGAMTGKQAFDVVMRAGSNLLDPDVAWAIVDAVSASSLGEEKVRATLTSQELELREASPALLSLMCRELNVLRKKREMTKITRQLVEESRRKILETFYAECLHAMPEKFRVYIEEHLVTPSGFRHRALRRDILDATGVSSDQLEQVIDSRLLSYEDSEGVRWVELSHDLLTKVAVESRDQRTARKELADSQLREEQAKAVARERAAEVKRWRNITRGAVLCVAAALIALWFALREQHISKTLTATQKTLIQKLISENGKVMDLSSSELAGVPSQTSLDLLTTFDDLFNDIKGIEVTDREIQNEVTANNVELKLTRAQVLLRASGNVGNHQDALATADKALNQIKMARDLAGPKTDLQAKVDCAEGDALISKGLIIDPQHGPNTGFAGPAQNAIDDYARSEQETDNPEIKIQARLGSGDAHRYLGQFDLALNDYGEAQKLAHQYQSDPKDIALDLEATSYNKIGIIYGDRFKADGEPDDLKTAFAIYNKSDRLRDQITQDTGEDAFIFKYNRAALDANLATTYRSLFRQSKKKDTNAFNNALSFAKKREDLSKEMFDQDHTNAFLANFYALGLTAHAQILIDPEEIDESTLEEAQHLAAEAVSISGEKLPDPLYVHGLIAQLRGDTEEVNRIRKLLATFPNADQLPESKGR